MTVTCSREPLAELCSAVLAASGDLWWERQEPILFQDPVYDNIALGCKGGVSKADVEQAAKLAGRSVFTFLRWCYMMYTFTWIYIMIAYGSVILPFRRSRRSAYRSSIMKIMNMFGKVKHLTVDRLCWSSCHIKSMVNDSQVLKHVDLLLSCCEASAHDFIMSFPMGYQTKAWLQEKKWFHVINMSWLPYRCHNYLGPSWRLPWSWWRARSEKPAPSWVVVRSSVWPLHGRWYESPSLGSSVKQWLGRVTVGYCGLPWVTTGLDVGTQEVQNASHAESEHLGVIFYAPPRQSCCWMRWDGTEWHRYQLCQVVPAIFGAEASVSHVGIPKAPNDPQRLAPTPKGSKAWRTMSLIW